MREKVVYFTSGFLKFQDIYLLSNSHWQMFLTTLLFMRSTLMFLYDVR